MEENWKPNPEILAIVKTGLDDLKTRVKFIEPEDDEDKYTQWTEHLVDKWPSGSVRLRLDFELLDDVEMSNEQVLDQMFEAAAVDLADLFENGDTSNLDDDPLLSAHDGSIKRGKDLKSIHIPNHVVYREHKPNRYEYTVYLIITTEWSE